MPKNFASLLLTLGVLAGVAVALSACDTMDDDMVVESVDQAPPQEEIEIVPTMDDPDHTIWRPGYWVLSGAHFVWVSGKIISRPAPTAIWSSAHWVHHTFGWSFEQGHWE